MANPVPRLLIADDPAIREAQVDLRSDQSGLDLVDFRAAMDDGAGSLRRSP